MSRSNESLSACAAFSGIISFVFFLVSMVMLVMYFQTGALEQKRCNILEVVYPTRLPQNVSDMAGFTNCDCGKRCISDLGICISVFGNVINSDNTEMFRKNIYESNSPCTESEEDCPNGESIQDRLEAINNAENTAEQFIEKMNSTINCYLDTSTNKLYLENEFDIVAMFVIFGLFNFFFIIFIINICKINKCLCFKDKVIVTVNQIELNDVYSH